MNPAVATLIRWRCMCFFRVEKKVIHTQPKPSSFRYFICMNVDTRYHWTNEQTIYGWQIKNSFVECYFIRIIFAFFP